jgi:hypothetical protein
MQWLYELQVEVHTGELRVKFAVNVPASARFLRRSLLFLSIVDARWMPTGNAAAQAQGWFATHQGPAAGPGGSGTWLVWHWPSRRRRWTPRTTT